LAAPSLTGGAMQSAVHVAAIIHLRCRGKEEGERREEKGATKKGKTEWR
jgi:hypothetical protein